jgi:hypothetical protein
MRHFLFEICATASDSEYFASEINQFPMSSNCHVLPPSMTSIATFCNVPVSLDWIMNSGVPTQNSRASGLLSLPCDAGVLSMFLNGISVAASLPSDLVLGLDWFQFVCNSTNPTSAVVVQLISGPLELRHNSLTSAGTS